EEKFTEGIDVIEGIRPMEGISLEDRVAALEQTLQTMGAGAPAPAPAAAICTAFASMPVGLGPNPRPGNQAKFLVRQFGGMPAPNTRIVSWNSPNGVFQGLDCGFTCEAWLATPASSVILSLVHFAHPATIQAFNNSGILVGSAVMSPAQATVQS